MKALSLLTPSKINLSLDIVGQKEDGYHLLQSVFQAVRLYDTITIEKSVSGIRLQCSADPPIPCDQRNLAYRAAELFCQETGLPEAFSLKLEKDIPSQAGLGGGSADAAAVLFGLNQLTESDLSISQLCELGAKLGADVPFFFLGGTVLAEGIGEHLTPLPPLPSASLVIAKGTAGISTPEAYRRIDGEPQLRHPSTGALLKAIETGNWQSVAPLCANVFEQVTDDETVCFLRSHMTKAGALCAMLSGSGSAVFGLFETPEQAQQCAESLKALVPFSRCCCTSTKGIELL